MISKIDKFRRVKKISSKFIVFAILGGLMLILLFSLSLANWRLYKKRVQLKSQIDSISSEIENIKNNTQALKSNIAKTETQAYLEKVARERLNLKKRGERVVAVIVSEASKEENKSSVEEKPWWKTLLERLFKINTQY